MNQSATVLTINQTHAAEQAAVDAGSSFWQLMETAGTAAAQDLLKRSVNSQRYWILCGKGNNGGDGLVMARILAQAGKHVTVSLMQGGVSSDLASQNLAALELLSNLVYGIQAAFSVDCSSSCLPSLKMTLLTTKVNKLNP